jgi:hypothetical protein
MSLAPLLSPPSRVGFPGDILVTYFVDESCLDELLVTLSGCAGPAAGTSDLTLCEGFIELRFRPLGGRAVCAALIVDGVLWVVIDLNKFNALGQAREMLEEWRQSCSSRQEPRL